MASKVGKILVVDDNLGIRRALEILLPMHFAEVKTIPSPATLVGSLEQFRPDVVLLDMNFKWKWFCSRLMPILPWRWKE